MEEFQEYPKWLAEYGKIAHTKEEEQALKNEKVDKPETIKLKKK